MRVFWVGRVVLAAVLFTYAGPTPLGLVSSSWAQSEAASGTVTGTGSHMETLPPQRLRLLMPVRAEGTDTKGAIKALAQHKERVKKELLEMNAVEGSIQFSTPMLAKAVPGLPISVSQGYNARNMLRSLGRGSASGAEKLKMHVAISTVTVDWQLPTSNLDAISLLPETLQEQVESRDLQGKNNHVELDAATKEKVEELQAAFQEQMGGYSDEEGPDVRITFVADVTDGQRQSARQRAFDAARQEAEELAKVAGRSLGDVVNVRASINPWEQYRSAMSYGAMEAGNDLFQQQAAAASGDRGSRHEVVAERPDQLFLTSQVQVEYRLK
ncbi:MAG: SIMPL domain-containing protein [Pirellulales bacterium]